MQCEAVKQRHAAFVQRQPRVFQAEAGHGWRPTRGRQHMVEALGLPDPVTMQVMDFNPGGGLPDRLHLRRGIQIKLFVEKLVGIVAHGRVMDAGKSTTHAKHLDPHTQTAHGLGQFQPQHTGAKNGQTRRQGGQVKDLFIGQQTRARRDGVDRFQHKADKTVALALYPRHHGRPVHRDHGHLHPEGRGVARLVRGLGGGNQQFAGHAAHARAGRAISAAFDQQHGVGVGAGSPVGAHAGGTGTHNGDFDLKRSHGKQFLQSLHGILDRVFCVVNKLLGVAQALFCLARDLFVDALGFLLFVAHEFAGLLLDFAGDVFHRAVDLILVHDVFPLKLSELLRKRVSG